MSWNWWTWRSEGSTGFSRNSYRTSRDYISEIFSKRIGERGRYFGKRKDSSGVYSIFDRSRDRVRGNSQNASQPVNLCVSDRIWLKKVMLHKRDTALRQRLGAFFRPDNVLGMLQNWSSILDGEFEFRIKVTELDTETPCVNWHERR